jgi:hypothetical protein
VRVVVFAIFPRLSLAEAPQLAATLVAVRAFVVTGTEPLVTAMPFTATTFATVAVIDE